MTRNNPFGFEPLSPEVLDRYLAGESTVAEAAEVRAWATRDPRRLIELETLRRSVDKLGDMTDNAGAEQEEAWANITTGQLKAQNRFEGAHDTNVQVPRAGFSVSAKSLGLWLGSLALVAVCYVLAGQWVSEATPKTVPIQKSYSTVSGQRATVTLADGSTVVLAPATTIRVTGREVDLDGEAVFTVTKNTGAPFIVRSDNSVTRVLGTTFGVRHYAMDSVTRVAVRDGKVELNNFVLSANNIGQVDHSGSVLMRANANVADMLSWTSGSFTVRNRRMDEIILDLERWYGIDIQITDESLGMQRVSGSFTESSPKELQKALEFILGARTELHGKVLVVHGRQQ